ncbi:RagB/SusD family nutrient uptake outer membrane protein [Sphingobacterium sp. HJSM2_6]|uniref:RagB/SusD family nutrient uptake outer membrane protein n=1 Tax=Sphingobacterium sp. HJSM2_6 TaxID=3366264 RepID=UPI003BDBD57A
MFFIVGCSKEFLQKLPQGQLSDNQLENKEGIEGALLGAYSIMNGNVSGTWGNYASAPSQWLFGEVASDNAHKGSEGPDQPAMMNIETYLTTSVNDNLSSMWQVYFEGVLRCNNTIRMVNNDQSGKKTLSQARAKQILGEVRLLRAHYYFFLWRIFRKLPILNENTTEEEAKTISNDQDILPQIEADMKFAMENLTKEKYNNEAGRFHVDAAKAYLGKFYLYQKKYAQALLLFQEVMAGKNIVDMPYWNNFDVTKENGAEVLVVAKHGINKDGSGDNGNVGDMLAGIHNTSAVGCYGFYQPTFDLVNAYKVDGAGLPYLDGSYRNDPYKSDFNAPSYVLDVSISFDPRLDYNVGRKGVEYLDYGIMPGNSWIRQASFGGPFVGIKTMIPRSLFASESVPGAAQITGLDVNIIRLADVYLMAAECEVELGNLDNALKLVNDVRLRASKLPAKKTANGSPAANYLVSPYPHFSNADYARQAVRFERRLELAMEGHRFFDLVRWGIAKQVIESYSAFEGGIIDSYKNLKFNGNNEYWPIPQVELDRNPNLKPN